jgi:hypothetical protein
MAHVNERIERMISRQLDGELSAEEELELNQELIHSPAARGLMEEYEKNDLMARMVLRTTLAPDDVQPEFHPAEAGFSRGTYRVGWGLASAVAVAASVALILSAPSLFRAMDRRPMESIVAEAAPDVPHVGPKAGISEPTKRPLTPLVGPQPLRRTHVAERKVDRFVIPVLVEDDEASQDMVPMWEVQRRRVRVQQVSEEL